MGGYINRLRKSGAWKVCPECGRKFFVNECESWAYRRYTSQKGLGGIKYFCKWSCLVKYDREYEEAKKKKRSETATLAHKKRKEKEKDDL